MVQVAVMETKMSRKPTHIIYAVLKTEGRDDRWQALGALWPHADGNGYNLSLPIVPRDPNVELVIRKAKPKAEHAPAARDNLDDFAA
jgi:hypothetical protein